MFTISPIHDYKKNYHKYVRLQNQTYHLSVPGILDYKIVKNVQISLHSRPAVVEIRFRKPSILWLCEDQKSQHLKGGGDAGLEIRENREKWMLVLLIRPNDYHSIGVSLLHRQWNLLVPPNNVRPTECSVPVTDRVDTNSLIAVRNTHTTESSVK